MQEEEKGRTVKSNEQLTCNSVYQEALFDSHEKHKEE
jgi:hypothetical protein